MAETDASGNTTAEYIFFGSKRIAMIPSSGSPPVAGNPQYFVEDFLGSSRVVTQSNGVPCYDADFTPFGTELPYTNNCPSLNTYKFEGKERDTETSNDDFGARYYTWRFGRWLSADWSSVPVPVPYANLTNPQTLNLYAMVADDPESFADLDGHYSAQHDNNIWDDCIGRGGAYCVPNSTKDPAEVTEAGLAQIHESGLLSVQEAQDQQAQQQGNPAGSQQGQQSSNNQSSHSVNISYWWTGAGGSGHIGVGVDDGDNTFGFSTFDPHTSWYKRLFGAPKARVEPDIPQHTDEHGNVAPHSYIRISITVAQATAMKAAIDQRTHNPGRYNMIFNNCAGFVEGVLHAGRVSGVPHREILSPAALGAILAIGNSFRRL